MSRGRCRNNEITAPDRSVDNSTLWQADYNAAHYQDMYFNRFRRYWEKQSSNRYSVAGEVQAWVKVPFNEALYGRNYCGGIVCDSTKALIRDAMAVWVRPARLGQDDGRDHGIPADLRPPGPVRHRRRRQLRRAGRVHRPLPDRPFRRG